MAALRTVVRAPLVIATIAVYYTAFLLLLPAVAWSARRRRRWRARIFRGWSRAMSQVLGLRLVVEETPPEPPFLMVSNHLSYIDVVVLASQLRTVFVAKAEVRKWPVFGVLCRSFDTIFIDRGSRRDLMRAAAEIREALAWGDGVVIFPEGTSTRGSEVGSFKPALLEDAARCGQPVHYVSLSYRTAPGAEPAHERVCFWGDAYFLVHLVKLLRVPSFEARVRFGEEPLVDDDRKRLAMRLHGAVAERFIPVVEGA